MMRLFSTGILIEPNIELYQRMVKKNRNASYINSCVSPTKFTEEYEFVNAEGVGGIKGTDPVKIE